MASEVTVTALLIERFARCGEKLLPDVREDILAQGSSVVPELIRIVDDDELATEGSPGEGWAPIHAVDLLVDLQAVEAVPALLSALVRSHWENVLYNKIAVRLPELGQAVFEPAAVLMETVEDEEARSALCSILAQLGVRDERVFAWCKESFAREPVVGAINFGDYGDERALPLLRQAIEELEPDWESPFGMMDIKELVEAYKRIAGALPEDLADYVESLERAWEERRKQGLPFSASSKVGRNEPCPCGSGKKFKKCCGAA